MEIKEFTFRILIAILLGVAIGLERQLTGHRAGIRINVLICMGACFFALFPTIFNSDQVFRVGASIITGVGFLCSGVIFKDNASVRGMNTAATLWCSAAVGLMTSVNCLFAFIATTLLILSNIILRPIALKIKPLSAREEQDKEYRISITCLECAEDDIRHLLINTKPYKTLFLNNLKSGDVVGNKVEVVAEFYSMGKSKENIMEEIVSSALKNNNVLGAGWEIV